MTPARKGVYIPATFRLGNMHARFLGLLELCKAHVDLFRGGRKHNTISLLRVSGRKLRHAMLDGIALELGALAVRHVEPRLFRVRVKKGGGLPDFPERLFRPFVRRFQNSDLAWLILCSISRSGTTTHPGRYLREVPGADDERTRFEGGNAARRNAADPR